LAFLALDQGDQAQAIQLFTATLHLCRELHDLRFIALCFEGFGRVAAGQNQSECAARLFGAARALREKIGMPIVEAFLARQLDRDLTTARAALSERAFSDAWDAGQRMSLDDAVALALGLASDEEVSVTARDGVQSGATTLSPREMDVLRLLVDGKSDREIAAELFISHHTVMRHVSHILGKLGVESRTAAATWAVRHDLR
jgi:DNA-binding CsgD family transcriptional regulator